MRTLAEIQKTPVGLLSDAEINLLSPADQDRARKAQAQMRRERECPGHEAVGTGSYAESMRGWHPAHCKHCGMDMSVDSGD